MNLDKRAPIGVGVVLKRDNYVLLGKRKGSHGAGSWALPGGKPDHGEAPVDAARRELLEETGISCGPYGSDFFNVLPVWTYDRFEEEQLHYVTLYYSIQCPPDATPRVCEPEKCEEWKWFPRTFGLPRPLFRGAREAIEVAWK